MDQKTLFTGLATIMLFGVSSVMGFMGLTAEMGLAIVAGALGLAFANLDKFKRISGAGFSAELLEAVIEKETEFDHAVDPKVAILDSDQKTQIASALLQPKYTWRTANGVANETALPVPEVKKTLKSLEAGGLARCGAKQNGEEIWAATAKLRSGQ